MTTSKAYVFDIKRFAVHDGYGIRTTIFFKGCPLRCKWCQNPEGLETKPRVLWFEKNCIHCRLCEKASMPNQMHYDERPYFNKEYSGDFDNLVHICPSSAIRYDSTLYTVEELMSKIEEDRVFFKRNGGVTFSGGEPFLQKDFLVDILKECKKRGIHTAIESSFYANLELVKQVVPYLDLIFADLKVFDETDHKAMTGVSNQKILQNIEYLLTSEHKDKVIIRTPLIPGYNATERNLSQISSFISSLYPEVKYELLNYNPLASSKYDLVDMEYEPGKLKPFAPDELETFKNIVKEAGIKNIIEV